MIRDVYIIKMRTGECSYHHTFTRTPVDISLVTGFLSAMSDMIRALPQGSVKSVPAGNYKFTYTPAGQYLYVICSDADEKDVDLEKKIIDLKDVMQDR